MAAPPEELQNREVHLPQWSTAHPQEGSPLVGWVGFGRGSLVGAEGKIRCLNSLTLINFVI